MSHFGRKKNKKLVEFSTTTSQEKPSIIRIDLYKEAQRIKNLQDLIGGSHPVDTIYKALEHFEKVDEQSQLLDKKA